MRREVEDEESGWGEQVRRDWKELEVKDVDHWMHLVEDRAWLRFGLSRQLKRAPSADDDGEIADEGEEDGEEGAEEAEE